MRKLFLFIALSLTVAIYAVDITVSEKASDIGTANGWKNGQAYYSFTLNDRVTFAVKQSAEGKQNGYYWNDQDPADWRIYQARNNGEFTVSVPSGYVIHTMALEYYTTKAGVLSRVAGSSIAEENQIASGQAIEVDASSITLYAANMKDSTAGQVRLTRFTVTYSYADTTSLMEGFSKVEQTQNNEVETLWDGDICHWKALRVRRAAKDTLNGGVPATWFNQKGYLHSTDMEGGIKHLRFAWREFVTTVDDLKLAISVGDCWNDTVVVTSSGSFPTSKDWYYDKDIQCKENGQLKLMNISDTATHRFLIGDVFITPYIYFPPEYRAIEVQRTEKQYDLSHIIMDNTDGEGEIVYTIVADSTGSATIEGSIVDFSEAPKSGPIQVQASWNNGKVKVAPITLNVVVMEQEGESFSETFSSCTKTQMTGTTYVVGDEGVYGWNMTNFIREATDTIQGIQATRVGYNGRIAMNGAQEGGIKSVAFWWRAASAAHPVHFTVRVDGKEYDYSMATEASRGELQQYIRTFNIAHNTAFSFEMGAQESTLQSKIIVGRVDITPYVLFRVKRDTVDLEQETTYALDSMLINNTKETVTYSILKDETGAAVLSDGVLDMSAVTKAGNVQVQVSWGQVTTTMFIYVQMPATGLHEVQNAGCTMHNVQKVVINNQLYIVKDGIYYTPQGFRR